MRAGKTVFLLLLAVLICSGCVRKEESVESGQTNASAVTAQAGNEESKLTYDPNHFKRDAELVIEIDGRQMNMSFHNTEAAFVLYHQLEIGEVEASLEKYDGKEKAMKISVSLPSDPEEVEADIGDVILLEDGRILLCYREETVTGTPIGTIPFLSLESEYTKWVGRGKKVTLFLDWLDY